jgi:hypothetical protein
MRCLIPPLASLSLAVAAIVTAQQPGAGDLQRTPMVLTIEPAGMAAVAPLDPSKVITTTPGFPVTIRGVVALDMAQRTVTVTVTPPQGSGAPPGPKPESDCPPDENEAAVLTASGRTQPEPPSVLTATASSSGTFDVQYTPKVTGRHTVVARAGPVRGDAKFDVARVPKALPECDDLPAEDIQQELDNLVKNVCDLTPLLKQRVDELPESPAKDEFKGMLDEFDKQQRPCQVPDQRPAINALNYLHRRAPAARPFTGPLREPVRPWLETARETNRKVPAVRAELTAGNILCDKIDIIINGLKFFNFAIGLVSYYGDYKATLMKFFGDPMMLVGKIPPVKRSPVLNDTISTAWKIYSGLLGKDGKTIESVPIPKITDNKFGESVLSTGKTENLGEARQFGEFRQKIGVLQKQIFSLATYAGSRVFEKYCQEFRGPVKGGMEVEFYKDGITWWSYSTLIEGELILRYPKDANATSVRLTGEFLGNAKKFASKDEAIRVQFPGLSYGTIIKQIRLEPLATDNNPLNVDFIQQPITKGGAITRYFFQPAFFRVPVKAEMTGDTIRLELQPATVDFDDLSTKVINIAGPVLSLQPALITYVLPYKGAHFILFRAMNDGPIEFTIKRDQSSMRIERLLERTRTTAMNKGRYKVDIKACNPGGYCK